MFTNNWIYTFLCKLVFIKRSIFKRTRFLSYYCRPYLHLIRNGTSCSKRTTFYHNQWFLFLLLGGVLWKSDTTTVNSISYRFISNQLKQKKIIIKSTKTAIFISFQYFFPKSTLWLHSVQNLKHTSIKSLGSLCAFKTS